MPTQWATGRPVTEWAYAYMGVLVPGGMIPLLIMVHLDMWACSIFLYTHSYLCTQYFQETPGTRADALSAFKWRDQHCGCGVVGEHTHTYLPTYVYVNNSKCFPCSANQLWKPPIVIATNIGNGLPASNIANDVFFRRVTCRTCVDYWFYDCTVLDQQESFRHIDRRKQSYP